MGNRKWNGPCRFVAILEWKGQVNETAYSLGSRARSGASGSTLTPIGVITAQDKPQVPDSSVVKKSIKAVGYEVGGGSTKVVLVGTPAAPNASGEAKVEATKRGTRIEVKVIGLPQPTTLGAEFLTYVLWIVTPDGSTTNLGEIPIDKNGEGKLTTTAQSQTFAMGVTAEPYFAVQLPSEIGVLVNDTTKKTKGKIYPENSYRLMKRSQYAKLGNPLALTLDLKNVPLDMYEARNAVDIARSRRVRKSTPPRFSAKRALVFKWRRTPWLRSQTKARS